MLNLKERVLKFGPEWMALELVSKGLHTDEEITFFRKLFTDYQMNIGKLVEIALRNKIAPMLAWNIFEYDVYPKIHHIYAMNLRLLLDYTKNKNEIYIKEIERITDLFEKEQIEYVLTKGIVLVNDLYNNLECRGMNDIDIITKPENSESVKKLLKEAGYVPGVYDLKTNKINPFSREDQILCNVTGNKILGHVKGIDDNFVHAVYVGVDLSLTWSDSNFKISVDEAFEDRKKISVFSSDNEFYTFADTTHFIYLILHLLKHAWAESLRKSKDSCTLMQYADIYHFWNKHKDELISTMPDKMKQYGIECAAGWVLGHVDRLFSSDIVKTLQLEEYATDEILNTIITRKNQKITFSGSMQRMLLGEEE